MLWQGVSIGCSAVSTIVHAGVVAGAQRELTPLEAVDDSARCTFIPAMVVSAISHLSGMKDNACTLKVARDAFTENNSPRAREELLWRDGSWERRQQKFLARYYDCYHDRHTTRRVQHTHRRRR
jgi:hypothetical protein